MSSKGRGVESMTLKPSECSAAIRAMIPTQRAIFMWGPPGISKSDTLRGVAASEGMGFVDVRLSQMDPTDLRGIPFPVIINGVTGVRWSAPLVLPRDLNYDIIQDIEAEPTTICFDNALNANVDITVHSLTKGAKAQIIEKLTLRDDQFPDKNGIIHPDAFVVQIVDSSGEIISGKIHWKAKGKVSAILALEEFNSAPPSVQAAAYQLVLDRRLGEYKVPNGVFIVALGNRDTDKGVTFKMPTPIMNRFVHVEMRCDFDDWQVWALGYGIHPEVIGYLTTFKECLFSFEPGTAARGFPTPRSWHFVSDIISKNQYLPEQIKLGLITGAVGDAEGAKFMAFSKIASELPKADEILSGKLTKLTKKTEVQLAYALTVTLCYELKERAKNIQRKYPDNWKNVPDRKRWLEEADNFLMFMMENFMPEICVLGARTAIRIHGLPFETTKMKNFEKFCNNFKDLIVQ